MQAISDDTWLWMAGAAGSLVSLHYTKELTWTGKALSVAAGTFFAGFCGGLVTDWIHWDSRHAAPAIHFVLGLLGLLITGGLVKIGAMFEASPIATIIEVLKKNQGK